MEKEVNRFRRAVEQSKLQLQRIKEKLLKEGAKEHVYIIDAHLLILEDRMLIDDTIKTSGKGLSGRKGR